MNLHGMSPERYIEILERTVNQKSDEITADTLRLAELMDENERLRALLARTAAFVDVDILKNNAIGEDLRTALVVAP